jgi:hypothetical protein
MKDYVDNRRQEKQKIKTQKEIERLSESLRKNDFTNEEIELINNSPYSDIILNIANSITKEEKTKK